MSRRVKIRGFTYIWMLAFLFFFRPAPYIIGTSVNRMLNYLVLGMCGLLMLLALYLANYGYRMKMSVFCIMLLYFWCLTGSSICNMAVGNSVDFQDVVHYFTEAAAFLFLCDIGLWYSPRRTLKSFLKVGILMTTINAITFFVFFHSGGMNHGVTEFMNGRQIALTYFFLGRDNATYFWTWPVIVIIWFYCFKYKLPKKYFVMSAFYTLLQAAAYLYVESGLASVACISVPIVLWLLKRSLEQTRKLEHKKKKKHHIVKLGYMWVIAFGFDIFLTLFAELEFFQRIIQEVFNKSATISGRTYIWAKAYKYIVQSPLIGYGCEPENVTIEKLLINHAHNIFLETLYRGGLIGLLLFALLFVVLTHQTRKFSSSAFCKYLVVNIFLFLIFSSVEFAYYRYHFILIFLLVSHMDVIKDSIFDRLK